MQHKRRDVEQVALSLFAQALEARGISPIHAREITNQPDVLFMLEARALAVECTYVSHQRLLALLARNKWPPDDFQEVLLPVDPNCGSAKPSSQRKEDCRLSGAHWRRRRDSAAQTAKTCSTMRFDTRKPARHIGRPCQPETDRSRLFKVSM